MAKYFLSAHEWIRKRNFEVYVPAYFHTNLPEHMVNSKPTPLERPNKYRMVTTNRKNPLPFRQIIDPNQLQRASYSCETMLAMFQKKVEFQLVSSEDVVEILDGIDRYLLSLQADVELGNERIIDYVRLVISWREEVYKHYYRYMKLNPTALEKLYPNNDPNNNLLSLMAGIGIRQDRVKLDPLRAKADPPYRVDAIIPKETATKQSDEDLMESSYGLSKSNPHMQDITNDFDFDDFLKGG